MRFFVRERDFRAEVDNRTRAKLADTLDRYGDNEHCLRLAVAAHCGVDPKTIIPGSMMLPAMRRAVKAYARAVAESRARLEKP